jgi:endonuclease/exonuclease/phosphatase family metal-dependent hydrolase
MKLRLATFNIENLFTRFDFASFQNERGRNYLPEIVRFYADFNSDSTDVLHNLLRGADLAQGDDKRQHTALAMTQCRADIYCLQEVDNIEALSRFVDLYLHKTSDIYYDQLVLHEGNDIRGIDNAIVARKELDVYTRSHASMLIGDLEDRPALVAKYPKLKSLMNSDADLRNPIFERDCLEVEVRSGAKTLTVFVCHFKSMSGGRDDTMGQRQLEASAVRQIVGHKFANPAVANWLVVGDLNDYLRHIECETQADGTVTETIIDDSLVAGFTSGLRPLLDGAFSANLLDRLPAEERWTHYFSGARHKTQLDYILASPPVAAAIDGPPQVVRGGQPYRTPNLDAVARYPRVGWDRPKASDHCPQVVEIDFDRLA